MSTFSLLGKRRFLPFFCTQFLGAFNDNLFKNTMVILLAYRAGTSEASSGLIINLAAGLFILPFFLFSSVSGQLADKYEKSQIMRIIKLAEIAIMGIGAIGFYFDNTPLLFVTLFLMGTHSAFFGPAKYSILPQHLKTDELVAGNAAVEMGTFLAILLGELAGGVLAAKKEFWLVATGIVSVAVLGYIASRFILLAPATAPDLKLNWNPFKETANLWRLARKKESVFNSILGISWFWYFGAVMLAQLPSFSKHTLGGDESVVTLLLAVFSISIGIGSVLCEKLSRGEIELGVVPLGAIGMSIFCADLYFIDYPAASNTLIGVREFISHSSSYRVVFDLTMIGIFSSLFIVPLYALIQYRSDPAARSRIIAANNVINSVFMVSSAIITMGLVLLKLNTVEILLVTALMNLAVTAYVFMLIPEFFMRFVIWAMASTIYRLRYEGREQIPREGACLVVCNHVSFIDWFIITAACRRPVRFVMDHHFYKVPGAKLFFNAAKAIPIAPAKEDAALKEKAFDDIAVQLADGQIVCIFPEGKITHTGAMNSFRPGVERILQRTPVPVYPMAINGLWGSFFSRKGGSAMSSLPRPSHREILVRCGPPLPPETKVAVMEQTVAQLLA